MSVLVDVCGCANLKRPDEWHHRRGTEPCADAVERSRANSRAKYARQVMKAGRTVRPMVYGSGGRWVPGSDVVLPEVDPL